MLKKYLSLIKKTERKTYVISFGIDILKESAILANHTPFSIYNYNIKKEKFLSYFLKIFNIALSNS
jgi:hypothetical protein